VYEDEVRQVPSEEFFVRWYRNIYDMFTEEWDEGDPEWESAIPVFF